MAHFAKLGVNGKVIAVHGLDNDQMLNAVGQEDVTDSVINSTLNSAGNLHTPLKTLTIGLNCKHGFKP